MAISADFDQHFFISQKVQTFFLNFCELHIIKCISNIFQELFSELDYLKNFLSYVVIEYYKREKSYCIVELVFIICRASYIALLRRKTKACLQAWRIVI